MKARIQKKQVATLALAGVLLSQPALALAAEFKDVPATHWAYSYISRLSEAKVIAGYPDKTYKPENPVQYLEVLRLLQGVINPSAEEVAKAIRDKGYIANEYNVPSWAKESVCVALENEVITELNLKQAAIEGLVSNKEQDEFPSRQTIAVYYARALKLSPNKDHSVLKHKDLDKLGVVKDKKIGEVNVADYVSALVRAGIFAANGADGYFEPNRPIQRAEMATITDLSYNYNKQVANKESIEAKILYVADLNNTRSIALSLKDGSTVVAKADENTKYTKNKVMVSPKDLKEGQSVKISAIKNKANSDYKALEIEILSTEVKGIGKVQLLANNGLRISYTTADSIDFAKAFYGEKTEDFTLAKDVKLKQYGREVSLSAIGASDFVEFVAEDNAIKEINVIPKSATLVGTVNYDTSGFNNNGYGKLVVKTEDGKNYEFSVKDFNLVSSLLKANENPGKKYEIGVNYKEAIKIDIPQNNETIVGFLDDVSLSNITISSKTYPLADQVKFMEKSNVVAKNLKANEVSGELWNLQGAILEVKVLNGKLTEILVKSPSLTQVNTYGTVEASIEQTIFGVNKFTTTLSFDRKIGDRQQMVLELPKKYNLRDKVSVKAYVDNEGNIYSMIIDGEVINFNVLR